jgi:hypothetical protein
VEAHDRRGRSTLLIVGIGQQTSAPSRNAEGAEEIA